MTALTATTAGPRPMKDAQNVVYSKYLMKGSSTIYHGGLVMLGTDGYAIPAADTANCKVVGVADETVTSSSTDGAYSIRVMSNARFKFTSSSTALSDFDAPLMYVVDDNTVDETSPANSVKAGIMVAPYISTTAVWLHIPAFGMFTYGL